jgi:hypothetical protein
VLRDGMRMREPGALAFYHFVRHERGFRRDDDG